MGWLGSAAEPTGDPGRNVGLQLAQTSPAHRLNVEPELFLVGEEMLRAFAV